MQAELDGDLETTMATMTAEPHLTHVPAMTGGVGHAGVRQFYAEHLIGRFFPDDVEIITVSRTADDRQLVDETVVRFTHDQPIDWMLPGVAPTGRQVEVSVVVIVAVEAGKVAHEHIYWDQASVLAQIGLLDPTGLPICPGHAAKVLDPSLPNWKF